jgi:hypothetical protein
LCSETGAELVGAGAAKGGASETPLKLEKFTASPIFSRFSKHPMAIATKFYWSNMLARGEGILDFAAAYKLPSHIYSESQSYLVLLLNFLRYQIQVVQLGYFETTW